MPIVRYRYHGLPILSHRLCRPRRTPRTRLYLRAWSVPRPTTSDTITEPASLWPTTPDRPPPSARTPPSPPRPVYRQATHELSIPTNNLITSHRQCVVSQTWLADFHGADRRRVREPITRHPLPLNYQFIGPRGNHRGQTKEERARGPTTAASNMRFRS